MSFFRTNFGTIFRNFVNSENMKNFKFRNLITGLLFCFCLLNASISLSDDELGRPYWQTTGGGCVPDDEAIQGNWYQAVTSAGRVKYRGDHTNMLRFTCAVTSLNGVPPNVPRKIVLVIYYQDPDGRGDDFQVIGRLMSFSKSDGALSEKCKVVSHRSGQWRRSISGICDVDRPSHLFNDELHWVEVTINRRQSSMQTVEFNGVELADLQ